MIEFFLEYKKAILRTLGALMLLVGFAVQFWVTPQKGYSETQRAAANVARMEKSLSGGSGKSTKKAKSNHSEIAKVFKETQAKQMKFLSIFAMIFGVCFLGYSFLKKD